MKCLSLLRDEAALGKVAEKLLTACKNINSAIGTPPVSFQWKNGTQHHSLLDSSPKD